MLLEVKIENPTNLSIAKSVIFKSLLQACHCWLTTMGLGFLEGRYHFLEDVDITINPSKNSVILEFKLT
ncbi:hypothetical protein MKW92_045121 [Papaver armeniacum]|nr:hypothetical protein MKW92_045121 [Papaver armeniacum]